MESNEVNEKLNQRKRLLNEENQKIEELVDQFTTVVFFNILNNLLA